MKKIVSFLSAAVLMVSMLIPVCAEGEEKTNAEEEPPAECQHSFGSWADIGNGHSRVCAVCGATESNSHTWNAGEVASAATCTGAGIKTFTCGVCGATKTESIPPAGHTYGGWQQADGTSHKRTCTVCGGEETKAHTWDSGTITTKPTCLAQGEKTFSCTECGASRKETLPIAGHTFSDWSADEKTHFRTCTVCGKTESGAHNWNGGTVKIPATCKEEGAFVYVCSVCGGALIEMIPKLTTHTYDNACDPDCNVCGAVREAKHKFSTAWSKNSREHWHTCTQCGKKTDIGKHYPGPAATEEKAQLCLTCGYTMTARLNHTHRFSDKLSWDDTGHWYACDGCEEQKDFETHSFDGPCDSDCNVCGYVTDAVHDYGNDWQADERGHWSVCTLCGRSSDREPHVPGPEATAEKAQFCTVCGYEIAPAREHEHTFEPQWRTDDAKHWKQCECGEKTEEALHTWDEGVRNKDKTVTFTCEVCGAERTEELPEKGFPWWIVLIGAALVCCGCGAAMLLYLGNRQQGRFAK